jgi:hypothetical protein
MSPAQAERFVQLVRDLGRLRAEVRQPPSEAQMAACALQCTAQEAGDAVIAGVGMLYVVADKPVEPMLSVLGVVTDVLNAMSPEPMTRGQMLREVAAYFDRQALRTAQVDKLLDAAGWTSKTKPQGDN